MRHTSILRTGRREREREGTNNRKNVNRRIDILPRDRRVSMLVAIARDRRACVIDALVRTNVIMYMSVKIVKRLQACILILDS